MNNIQSKELNLLEVIIDILNKNKIDYFLIGGSLLGAVRHKGFIPWDDDIDIGIPRKYFSKLKGMLDNSELIVHQFNIRGSYPFQFIKVRGATDKVINSDYNTHSQGIFVDLFPLDNLGNSRFIAKIKFNFASIINKLILLKFIDKTKNLTILFTKLLSLFIPKYLLFNILRFLTRTINDTKYVGNMFGRYKNKEILLYNIFYDNNKIITTEFENLHVRIPINYHAYLTQIYGNYFTLPEINNRVSNHNGI